MLFLACKASEHEKEIKNQKIREKAQMFIGPIGACWGLCAVASFAASSTKLTIPLKSRAWRSPVLLGLLESTYKYGIKSARRLGYVGVVSYASAVSSGITKKAAEKTQSKGLGVCSQILLWPSFFTVGIPAVILAEMSYAKEQQNKNL